MATTIILLVLVLLIAFLVYVATRPGSFTIKRSILIRAKPADIYPYIASFRPEGWGKWSPWEKLDPDLKRTYSGSPSGVGSIYEWEGNKQVGAGRMEIHHAEAPSSAEIRLDFLRPFRATNDVQFHLIDEGDETCVTWKMAGALSYPMKMMHLFMDMDTLVGKDFDKGLADLKTVSEKKTAAAAA